MTYDLGIDVGTVYTCAVLVRDGTTEVLQLGTSSPFVPSVVALREDNELLWGEAAERRMLTDPTRTVAQFKRRFGDETPFIIGGAPFGAEVLTGRLVEHVVSHVSALQGEAPRRVALTHPAGWGPYKLDLLREAAVLAGIRDAHLVPEPVAAAVAYSQRSALDVGSDLLVYDLGGGTFDTAVVHIDTGGPRVVGTPEGIGQLGGSDFDQAILMHVDAALGGKLQAVDRNDPEVRAALTHLRSECQRGKEALSSDTKVEIPVLLADVRTTVQLTRAEFEQMVAPRLSETITVARRVVSSADLSVEEIALVLLVGGSARIPLVASTVREELGRPVSLDPTPKASVATGAALLAARAPRREDRGTARRTKPAKQPSLAKPVPPSPAEPKVDAGKPRRRSPALIGGVVAAVFVVGAVGAVALLSGSDAVPPVRLACAAELGAACDALDQEDGVDVTIEPVAETGAKLTSGDAKYDGWLAPSPAVDALASSGALESGRPIAGTRLGLAIWKDRANVLARGCGGQVSWKCIGEHAGAPWTDLGGDATWGDLKPGQPDPATTALGADTLGSQAVSFHGRSDLSSADFESDDFLNWYTHLQRAMRPASGTSPLEQMLAAGPGSFDVVGTSEAEAEARLSGDGDPRVRLLYPDPNARVAAVYASTKDAKGGDALRDIVTGDAGAAALRRAGWQPALKRSSPANLPDAGALQALLDTWRSVGG